MLGRAKIFCAASAALCTALHPIQPKQIPPSLCGQPRLPIKDLRVLQNSVTRCLTQPHCSRPPFLYFQQHLSWISSLLRQQGFMAAFFSSFPTSFSTWGHSLPPPSAHWTELPLMWNFLKRKKEKPFLYCNTPINIKHNSMVCDTNFKKLFPYIC